MANKDPIRVGIVDANPERGWSFRAHVPALLHMPDFKIAAVCTTKQESAEAAAQKFGAPLAFSDYEKLVRHPDIDLVAVTVKVTDHYAPTMAALEAGKHVYCEWPLGRNTGEAIRMRDLAAAKGVVNAVGLQARAAPTFRYVRDLVSQGYVGRVLSATMIASRAIWGATVDRAFRADRANGMNMLPITGGHSLDTLCFCLGEFSELSSYVVNQRKHVVDAETGALVEKTAPDHILVGGILENGAIVSVELRGGVTRGIAFLFEIHGTEGDLIVTGSHGAVQHAELSLQGGQGPSAKLVDMPIPDRYRPAPADVPAGPPYNVAQFYTAIGKSIREGTQIDLDFAEAVKLHRTIDAVEKASDTGQRQRL